MPSRLTAPLSAAVLTFGLAAGLLACAPDAGGPPPPAGDVDLVRVVADSHPRITGATDIVWTKGVGRFTVTMRNDTGSSVEAAVLFFTLLSRGYERRALTHLEYRRTGLPEQPWQRLPMRWDDPDEPEDLISAGVEVDFGPRESATYEVRIPLPRRPSLSGFALAVQLSAPGEREQWTRFAVRSRTGQRVRVTAPDTMTPFGGWQEFQVEVWTTRRLPHAVRLDLATSPAPGGRVLATTEFQEFRSGAWHPLAGPVPSTADFELPPGEHRTFRFRYRIGAFNDADRLEFGLAAHLRRAGETPDLDSLASHGKPIRLIRPSMTVLAPVTWPRRVGETVDFQVTVENRTKVAYPAHEIAFTIWPRTPAGQIHYRPEPQHDWKPLPLLPHGEFTDIEAPALAAGARRTYAIRVTMDELPGKASAWSSGMYVPAYNAELQGLKGTLRLNGR